MIPYIALALSSLAVGLGLVALFVESWRDAMRAEQERCQRDDAFSDGWRAGREQGKRDA